MVDLILIFAWGFSVLCLIITTIWYVIMGFKLFREIRVKEKKFVETYLTPQKGKLINQFLLMNKEKYLLLEDPILRRKALFLKKLSYMQLLSLIVVVIVQICMWIW